MELKLLEEFCIALTSAAMASPGTPFGELVDQASVEMGYRDSELIPNDDLVKGMRRVARELRSM